MTDPTTPDTPPTLPDTPKRRRLAVVKPPPKPVNPDCVELFRVLHEQAERGDVTEAVVVWLEFDGSTDNERTGISDAVGILGQLKLVADEISAATREE